MSGLYLLAVISIIGVIAILIARRIARPIRNTWLRTGATVLLTVAFMTLLVADELIGGYQFNKLCRESAVLRIDTEKARGRTVKVVIEPSNEILSGTAITIYHSHESFRDRATNEEIASNDWYVAKGGWFIRMLGISEGNAPITIGLPACSPPLGGRAVAEAYGFTLTK